MRPAALDARLRAAIGSIGGHMDVWAVFEDASLFGDVVEALAVAIEPLAPTKVIAIEARGFLLGGAVATRLGVGFVAVRKPGSLFPGKKVTVVTEPDYRGRKTELRMLARSLDATDRVAMVDDWIEVGAQAFAVRELVARSGAAFLGLAAMVDQADREVAEGVPVLVGLIDGHSLENDA